ncbi:aminotransferase class I/II-fold pyridoxal phosphate-dependent enzyme [Brachybacterium sp.]|uniref:aminotransferase class I/II-fold pyridoxal phosphate-dependent enzyme n=1 Tax=Brachybacterium sp. TaxID=1891286 RepID=UPI002ED2172E
MTARIPLSIPVIGSHERARLLEAVDSGWIAPAGPQLDAFETLVAERCGRRRAVGVASGSAALHLALLVAGVRPGDLVVCPTLTFVASANAIVHAGAVPLFVDCDSTGNVDPDLVEQAVVRATASGSRVGALLGVDLYGKVADHENLQRIADAHGTVLVVDAAESLGSRRAGRPAGSHGLVSAVSFNGNKMATASSGGIVLTDDDVLADRAHHLATQAREPVPHYEHHEIGFNFRLSNILAALGLAQVERLDEFLAIRRAHRDQYRALCDRVDGLEILGGEDAGDNCWLTSLVLDPVRLGTEPVALRDALAEDGIEARPVFSPMHRQPVYADPERFPRELNGTAERLYRTGLSVPSSPASSVEQIREVCDRIEAAIASAGRTAPFALAPSTGVLS